MSPRELGCILQGVFVFNMHCYFHSWILDLVPLWNTMPIYLLLVQNCLLETDIIDLFVQYWIFSCIHVCKSICSLWQYDSSKQLETPLESRSRKRRWTAHWMTAADLLPFFFEYCEVSGKRNRGTISPVYFNIDPQLISLKQKPLLNKEAHWANCCEMLFSSDIYTLMR